MNTYKLSNIPLNVFRKFLSSVGCVLLSTKGGHEIWKKDGLTRPIVLQTHVDPVSEMAIRANLVTLGISKKEFFAMIYAN